jgi:hypothetical protein
MATYVVRCTVGRLGTDSSTRKAAALVALGAQVYRSLLQSTIAAELTKVGLNWLLFRLLSLDSFVFSYLACRSIG